MVGRCSYSGKSLHHSCPWAINPGLQLYADHYSTQRQYAIGSRPVRPCFVRPCRRRRRTYKRCPLRSPLRIRSQHYSTGPWAGIDPAGKEDNVGRWNQQLPLSHSVWMEKEEGKVGAWQRWHHHSKHYCRLSSTLSQLLAADSTVKSSFR